MGFSRQGRMKRHRSLWVPFDQARVERHKLQLGAELCLGRFKGKFPGLRGIRLKRHHLCVLVVISSSPEAGYRDLPIPGPRLQIRQAVGQMAQAVPKWWIRVVDWFSTAGGSGAGGSLHFLTPILQGRGGKVGDIGAKNFFENVQRIEVTSRQRKRRIENRIMEDVGRPSIK